MHNINTSVAKCLSPQKPDNHNFLEKTVREKMCISSLLLIRMEADMEEALVALEGTVEGGDMGTVRMVAKGYIIRLMLGISDRNNLMEDPTDMVMAAVTDFLSVWVWVVDFCLEGCCSKVADYILV